MPDDPRSIAGLTDKELDRKVSLSVVSWQGRLHCAYLNDFRIAGGKPWGGGTSAKDWQVSLRDVIRAFPELQRVCGLDYLGRALLREESQR